MLEIESTLTEMKDCFDWLVGRVAMANEIISELEEMLIKKFKIEM
jgi:hypothetical protein